MSGLHHYRLQYVVFFNFKYIASIFAFLLFAAPLNAAAQSTNLVLYRDQAFEFQLPERATTAIIANPEIADILTQSNGALVLIGKKNGRTNLLIRDAEQISLATIMLDVQSDPTKEISIYQGAIRIEYQCAEQCRKLGGDQDKASVATSTDPALAPLK